MFKKTVFHLTGPICRCEVQTLTVVINMNNTGQPGLTFVCRTCKTELIVPHSEFLVNLSFDTPYPGEKKVNKPTLVEDKTERSDITEGGKVIPIRQDD